MEIKTPPKIHAYAYHICRAWYNGSIFEIYNKQLVHSLACTIELWSTREVWRARKKHSQWNCASNPMRKTDNNIRRDCSVKWIVTALMPSLLFRCFSLFLAHLSTLAQEKRSQNCLRFGTGGQSLCLYQLLSWNIIFSPSQTSATRAKKFWRIDLLTLSASTIEILRMLTYTECDRTSVHAMLW